MSGLRYLTVSGLCFGLHVAIMVVADRAGLPLPAAILLSFVLVVLMGYALHAEVTFGVARSAAGLLRYAVAMAAMLPVSAALLWLFSRALGWPMPIAAPAGAIATLAINFLLARRSIMPHPLARDGR